MWRFMEVFSPYIFDLEAFLTPEESLMTMTIYAAFNKCVLDRNGVPVGLQKVVNFVTSKSAYGQRPPGSDHCFLGELNFVEAGLAVTATDRIGNVKSRSFAAFWTCNFHAASLLRF